MIYLVVNWFFYYEAPLNCMGRDNVNFKYFFYSFAPLAYIIKRLCFSPVALSGAFGGFRGGFLVGLIKQIGRSGGRKSF